MDASTAYDGKDYFADEPFYSKEFGGEAFSFIDASIQYSQDSGLDQRWTTNTFLYRGADPTRMGGTGNGAMGQFDSQSFAITGENGELLRTSFNDFRNLLQHWLNTTVSQPPNIQAQAVNSNEESLLACETFDSLFNYYLNTYKSARLLKQSRLAVEESLYRDIGYCLVEWDPRAGDAVGVETDEAGQPIVDERGQTQAKFSGDLYFKARCVYDVFEDKGCEDEEECDWVIIRDQVNKYEYAKRFPDHATKILAQGTYSEKLTSWRRGMKRATKSNMIEVFKFYHRPTAGMPKGRYAIMLDADTVLLDGVNPYSRIPLFNVKAGDEYGSTVGYCPGNSIAPVQLAQDVVTSAQMTNYAMFGVQNVAVKDSDQFDVMEIAGGMNVWRYGDTAPAGINLAKQADGIGDFTEFLSRKGETVSGVNATMRGDPEASLKSGKALGIVQAAAVQFMSALAASYAQFLKDIGNFMLEVFKKYVKEDRITQVIGKNERMQSATWSAKVFSPIAMVSAELVDPAMRTLGFKTDLAMFLAQNGLTKTTQEFLTVIQTGQWKPMVQKEITTINLVHEENDDMLKAAQGFKQQVEMLTMQVTQQAQLNPAMAPQMMQLLEQQKMELAKKLMPPVLRTDDDDFHISEHEQVVASPATRRDEAVLAIALAHIAEHEENKLRKAQKLALDTMRTQAEVQQVALANGWIQPAPQPMPAEQGQSQQAA